MLKSIPNFVARTQAVLTAEATAVEIDARGADLLRQKLGNGDWIYASIADGIAYEVVRITAVSGRTIAIDRNVENTGAYAFTANAQMLYILGQAAVNDVISDVLGNKLAVTGSGAAKVTQTGTFAWNIHVDRINLVSNDPEIEVVDMFPTFFVYKQ